MSKFGDQVVRNRKIYGNCQVQSPEGILMFRCDDKKANWYLRRDLADVITHTPLVVKLKFNPKGLGNHEKDYGLVEMENRCVNCGSDEFLTRHHVVPFCYRKHLPMNMKSHNFHDVLSMCMDCHDSYERKADQLKYQLSVKYDAPIGGLFTKRSDLKILKYATTILKGADGIPDFRVEEMSDEIKNYLGRDWTLDDLQDLSTLKQQIVSETHGQLVMKQVTDLQEFIQIWRKHFVENNSLKHLPSNWRIENNLIINEEE